MSAFSKQVAQTTAATREEAKRVLSKTKMLKHPAVKEAFEMFPLNLRKKVSISLASYSNTVFLTMTMYDLDSFKDKRFTSLLERFIDWNTSTSDYTHGVPNKDVRFDKTFDDIMVSVTVMAYVKEESPLCRIVTTGFTEEVVRREIKQIVCA